MKYVLLYITIGVMTSSCTFKRVTKSMDISDFAGRRDELEEFVYHNFDSIEYDRFISPIHNRLVDYLNSRRSQCRARP